MDVILTRDPMSDPIALLAEAGHAGRSPMRHTATMTKLVGYRYAAALAPASFTDDIDIGGL